MVHFLNQYFVQVFSKNQNKNEIFCNETITHVEASKIIYFNAVHHMQKRNSCSQLLAINHFCDSHYCMAAAQIQYFTGNHVCLVSKGSKFLISSWEIKRGIQIKLALNIFWSQVITVNTIKCKFHNNHWTFEK